MRIPNLAHDRAQFARELIQQCRNSQNHRINRGASFRNMFYTGHWDGSPQSFLRTQDFIRDLASFLYSSADLRFAIDFYGQVSEVTRAKGKTAASVLYDYARKAHVETSIAAGVLSALIKGTAIHQTVWNRSGFEPYIIQPELFGVGREDIPQLERQDFFTHFSFMSPDRFERMINSTVGMTDEEKRKIMLAAARTMRRQAEGEGLPSNAVMKQIMVGGIAPYTTASSPAPQAGGQVLNWLYAPQAAMRPDVLERLIPYDQLWVWDDDRDDWATITMVGEVIVYGKASFNAFSESLRRKEDGNGIDKKNPLRGKHGYVQITPFPMEDYVWGWSSVQLVALLQWSINNRIDGINMMLRKQEDPPRYARGFQGVNQNAYAKLNRPGGYANDPNPNAKFEDLVKEIPADVWQSFHELNAMFDIVGGMPAVTRGEGASGVRSQGHADRLVQMGTARHKEPALEIERSVEEIAGLMLSVLQARDLESHLAWVKPGVQSAEIDPATFNPAFEPPAPGMQQVWFNLAHLPDNIRVTTDGHSQSPAFTQEAKILAVTLARMGAMSPARLVEAVHAPNADALVEDLERKEIQQAELIRQHPELLERALGGGGGRRGRTVQ